MTQCVPQGFGVGGYGQIPWGGNQTFVVGGTLPTYAPQFDIYCLGPCGPMANIFSYIEVESEGDTSHFSFNAESDLVLRGGTPNEAPAWVFLGAAVPQQFTFEFTCAMLDLPTNFSDPLNKFFLVGVQDATGASVGLFFSAAGIGYCGYYRTDSYYNLVLDSPIELLPGSQELTSSQDYQTIRVICDYANNKVYLYVTLTSDLPNTGHVLRYVLPVFPSSAGPVVPPDRTCIGIKGMAADTVHVLLDSMCLGSGAQIPNMPPVANAGKDQAILFCTVALLDGTASFDPEKRALTYKWRLIAAPPESNTYVGGDDGFTLQIAPHAPPAQNTNKFYSTILGEAHALAYSQRILSGDVLVIDGVPYNITDVGTDGFGFYVVVDGYILPDDLSAKTWQVYRQKFLAGKAASKCSFFADVPGFYKFDLHVHDGSLWSDASTVIVNAQTTETARGVVPDVSFLWSYLTDFYSRVDNIKPRFEAIWGAITQTVASLMLHLWQIDYSKSLRDIPRQVLRKWLHFSPYVEEAVADIAASQLLLSGYLSGVFPDDVFDLDGETLVITSPLLSEDLTITFVGNGLSTTDVVTQLAYYFNAVDPRFSVVRINSQDTTGEFAGTSYLRVRAPFHFTISAASTVDPALFPRGDYNGILRGTNALRIDDNTLRLPFPLSGIDITNTKYVLLDGIAYTLVRVGTHAQDIWPNQRLIVQETLPAFTANTAWILPDNTQTLRTDFYNACVVEGDVAVYEVVFADGSLPVTIQCPVLGSSEAAPTTLAVDLSPLAAYAPTQFGELRILFHRVIRRTYIPISSTIVDIPFIQPYPRIHDDTMTLRRNLDYFLETFRDYRVIRFVSTAEQDVWEGDVPGQRLWAENVYLDNRPAIESNFGLAVGVRYRDIEALPGDIDYLSAVRGIWFVLFNGPTVHNLRVGTQILLGLPFAEEEGNIVEIRRDHSDTLGRIVVQDAASPTVFRTYTFPKTLNMEVNPRTGLTYAEGDLVKIFEPLVQGAEVLDYVNDPTWFAGYASQGAMLEVEKFFKFLVRIDSAAFSLPALLFVQALVMRMKPTYMDPLFTVVKDVGEATVDVTDTREFAVTLELNDLAVSKGGYGASTMFDEPDPSPSAHVAEVQQTVGLLFTQGILSTVPAAGYTYGGSKRVRHAGTLDNIGVNVTGSPAFSAPGYTAQLLVDGAVAGETDFTLVPPGVSFAIAGPISVPAGATLTVRLLPNPANVRYPNISGISTTLDYSFVPPPAAPGGIQSRFDKSSNPGDPDVANNEAQVLWGFDNDLLSPSMAAAAVVTMELAAPTLPSYDMILNYDGPVFTEIGAYFYDGWILFVPPGDGVLLHPGTVILAGSGSLSHAELRIEGGRQDALDAYRLVIFVNGVEETNLSFTIANTGNRVLRYTFSPGLLFTPGDELQVYLRHDSPSPSRPFLKKVTFALGTGASWAFDGGDLSTPLPAGSYYSVRMV